MIKKTLFVVIAAIMMFVTSSAVAFDFGWRISPNPNPLPLKPWSPDYSLGLLQSSATMPLGTFQNRLVSEPPPLTWVETFTQCFTRPVTEQLNDPDNDWIFKRNAFGDISTGYYGEYSLPNKNPN